MIGLVIVSHSQTLAAGVKELADQMAQGKIPIAIAGGMLDDPKLIGTDPLMIKNAIQSVYSDAGVLVLVDIGSAVMSAQVAIEQLADNQRERVHLCEAPLVEGAIAAAAQGMAGADLQSAAKEAVHALRAKQVLFNRSESKPEEVATIPEDADLLMIEVPNQLGLHARPAARLIGIINQFEGQVWMAIGDTDYVSAHSISQVSTLGASFGDELRFRISSPQSAAIQRAIQDFAIDNFGDQLGPLTPSPTITPKEATSNHTKFIGVPAAEGIAISKAIVYNIEDPIVDKIVVRDVDAEITLFQKSIADTILEIAKIQSTLNKSNKEIFDFHQLLLNDVVFINEVISTIKENKYNAAFVWQQKIKKLENDYASMSSQYMRERAGDIAEIGRKVLLGLSDNISDDIVITEPGILVIDDLGPAAIATLDLSMVQGILMRKGGRTSHAAILARSSNIPAIVGLGSNLDHVIDGESIAMDGSNGKVWRADYHKNKIDKLLQEQNEQRAALTALLKDAALPAETLDGRKYPVMANVRNADDARKALEYGADGIGLFRTEFLFMNRETPPSEEEQYQAYLSVCQAIEGLPVTIRTLDVGGDKPIPYLDIPKEHNPYLGLRAIRYCLQDVDLFKTQLRAICRVSADYDVRLMYPMIAVPEEVAAANLILQEVQQDLDDKGIAYDTAMEVGIMIEVPSTIFSIPELGAHCDFFSIGTNDLTQYLLAMDRNNPAVAEYRSANASSVQNAIEAIIKKSLDENIEVAMCGELAGDPEMTETLIHFGLEEFSMSPSSIPAVKDSIRKLHYSNKLINDASDDQWMIQHLLRETGM